MKRERLFILVTTLLLSLGLWAEVHVTIDNPRTWTAQNLASYVGQTIVFDQPMYVTNNYSSTLSISPRRIFYPTNQAYPLSGEYNQLLSLNNNGYVGLTGVSGYHRCGEKIYQLCVRVSSTSRLEYKSGEFRGNTRADLQKGIPSVDQNGQHRLLVCTMNLEYYLAANVSTSTMGPNTYAEHNRQRAKTSQALATICADIYGLVEVEQGDVALQEIADDLSTNTGRNYAIISDGSQPNGTFTKAGYVYCSDVVEPYGILQENNTELNDRKKVQAFRELSTGEVFLFSLNHFKAKLSGGTGLDLDQGDGQGSFNHKRVLEAQSVISQYGRLKALFKGEPDILIMGDLNAYGKEDPITTMTNAGMIDLHRAFHADSSYSYQYNGQAGYLDHALCNATLYPQITGMCAYHINSDESDDYTYDKSSDQTMFRSSDHDPIIVGLALDSGLTYNCLPAVNNIELMEGSQTMVISNAYQERQKSFYTITTISGLLLEQGQILSAQYELAKPQASGVYLLNIYTNKTVWQHKIIIP